MFSDRPWLAPLIVAGILAFLLLGGVKWFSKLRIQTSGEKWKFSLDNERRKRAGMFLFTVAILHALVIFLLWSFYWELWRVLPSTMLMFTFLLLPLLGLVIILRGEGLLSAGVLVAILVWAVVRINYANRERKFTQAVVVSPPPPSPTAAPAQNASVEVVTVMPGMPISFDLKKGVDFDSLLILVNPKTWSDSLMVKIAMCESYGGNQYELGDSTRTIVLQGKGNRHDTGIMQINQEAHKEILTYLFGIEDSLQFYDINTMRGNINFAHRLREVKRRDRKTGFAEFEDWNSSAGCWKKGPVGPLQIPTQVLALEEVHNAPVDIAGDSNWVGPFKGDTANYQYKLTAEREVRFQLLNHETGEVLGEFRESPDPKKYINKTGTLTRFSIRVVDGMPARFRYSLLRS